MLDNNFLFHDQADSFAAQSSFGELINNLRKGDGQLVIVAGAGVSMDAGLPSWSELVDRMAKSCMQSDQLTRFQALNKEPLERTAGLILRQASENRPHATLHGLLLDGLEIHVSPGPGILAQAIVRLLLAYPGRSSLITTNFDWLLEEALEQQYSAGGIEAVPTSHSFEDWKHWVALNDKDLRSSVMHLHGMLPRSLHPEKAAYVLEPLILTEGGFLEHGSLIRENLRELLVDKIVLFVGISLNDLNIVAPLHKLRKTLKPKYAIYTPQLESSKLNEYECILFSDLRTQYIQESLNVSVINTRTYAQVAQVVSEAALAAAQPKKYNKNRGTLWYDRRYQKALKQVYKSVGANLRTGIIPSERAISLGWHLHKLFTQSKGPVELLRKYRNRRVPRDIADSEEFAAFLWLDDLSMRPGGTQGLRLITSSAYVHWESWSSYRVDRVSESSHMAATKARYSGKMSTANIPHIERDSMSWRGAWALPLMLEGFSSETTVFGTPLDLLQLGVVSINTTKAVIPEDNASGGLSILSTLTSDEAIEFSNSLLGIIGELLSHE